MELNVAQTRRDVLVIGASAGGLDPTYALLAALPGDVPIVTAVVIHRGAYRGLSRLAELVERRGGRHVVEARKRTQVVPGVVYLGPRDLHLVFDRGDVLGVRSEKEHFTRPVIDPLFVSAARWYGKRVMGLLLSGGGSDGVVGLIGIEGASGMSLVQRPDEADQPWMPMTALRLDHVDAALSIADLVRVIPRLALGKEVRVARPPNSWTAWAGRPR